MDELFNIIGKLYVDIYNMQKYMEVLQNKLKDQEKEILSLRNQDTSSSKETNE
jgi:hypothetical protein